MRRHHLLINLAVVTVLVSVTVGACQSRALGPTHLVVGQTSDPAAAELGLWVAQELGLFEKRGLHVELVRTAGGAQAQVLVSGDVDIMFGGPVPQLCAAGAGAELIDIAGLGPTLPYLLVSRPTVTSPQDLVGGRVGASSTGASSSYLAAVVGLEALGINRSAVTIIPCGGSGERLAALMAGSIDATVVLLEQRPRVDELAAEGELAVLADLSELDVAWANEDIVVTRAFADAHPETLEAFLKAIIEAHAWLQAPEHRNRALAITVEYAGLETLEDAVPFYELAVKDLSLQPYPSLEAMSVFVEVLKADFPELETFPVESFADPSWVQRLVDSGFVDSLSGGQ